MSLMTGPATRAPRVEAVVVDDAGVSYSLPAGQADDVVDVLFDGRRIWSFWLERDSEPVAGDRRLSAWPAQLRPFLRGTTTLAVVAHVSDVTLHDAEVSLGSGAGRIAVVNAGGQPLGIDKSNRIAQTFDTRSADQVAPLLDAIETVLAAIAGAGIEAFPAYGTLLGAVREGRLIGHDSDADLGYVSRHRHPVDVVRESFLLQRTLEEAGFRTNRYSGAAFKVDVIEGDGSVRGLDVFGGFVSPDGTLYLMGEIGAPFELDWIFPLGTTTLEGRTLPAPRRPEKLLEATYGPGWAVPDPAFKFETPRGVVRRLDGWFRGTRVFRNDWDRRYSTLRHRLPDPEPSDLARYVVEQEGVPARLVDLGAGRAGDSLWFARQGSAVIALDFVSWASRAVQVAAREEGLDLGVRMVNLHELRSWMVEGTRLAHEPGPRTVLCRHLLDATNAAGRDAALRLCEMALRDGGRLYLEFVRGARRQQRSRDFLTAVPMTLVARELRARGARVVHTEDRFETRADGSRGRPVGRIVAEWAPRPEDQREDRP